MGTGVQLGQTGLVRVNSKTSPQEGRLLNRKLVIQTLLQSAPLSRADVARQTGLAKPTVSSLIAELEHDGIVTEVGELEAAKGRRGKKGSLVDLRAQDFRFAAVDLSTGAWAIGTVTDLRGTVHARAEFPMAGATGEEAVQIVLQVVDLLIERSDRSIMGVGIATPGIVDSKGVVRLGFRLDWFDLPLADRVTEHTGITAVVVNDSHAAARGVAVSQPDDSSEPSRRGLLIITIEQGVGMGVILGGALLSGTHNAAGEIGHVTADENGPVCDCGRVGCLDAILAADRLRDRIRNADAASRGRILNDAGRALGTTLAPFVSGLDLGEIVVCGPPDLVDGPLLRAAATTIRARNLASVSHSLSVRYAGGTSELVLVGTSALVLSLVLGF